MFMVQRRNGPTLFLNDCLTFSSSGDNIYKVYASLQAYFKIEYNKDYNKCLGVDLDRRPYR